MISSVQKFAAGEVTSQKFDTKPFDPSWDSVTCPCMMFARHGHGHETIEKKSLASSYGPSS
jgi:hypothetical protein